MIGILVQVHYDIQFYYIFCLFSQLYNILAWTFLIFLFIMNNQLNGSSYYRANPYYQQGYLPDYAYKNRKAPANLVELPQGQQHFDPTNKKHFQRVGYYSTIAEENIIHNKQQIASPSRDKGYFRSLNVDDIQGATTNTLISKGVKNKLKAKEQLMRKKNEQQYLAQKSQQVHLAMQQDQRKQKEAIQKMRKGNVPNYHQKVVKLRTQQVQENIKNVLNTEQRYPKPNSPIYQQRPSNQQIQQSPRKQQQYTQHQNKQIKNDKNNYDYYKNQLRNTEQQIKQLQLQLSKVKDNRGSNNQGGNDNSNRGKDNNNQYNYEKQQGYMDKQNNYSPRDRQEYQRMVMKNQNPNGNNDYRQYGQPYTADKNKEKYQQHYQPKYQLEQYQHRSQQQYQPRNQQQYRPNNYQQYQPRNQQPQQQYYQPRSQDQYQPKNYQHQQQQQQQYQPRNNQLYDPRNNPPQQYEPKHNQYNQYNQPSSQNQKRSSANLDQPNNKPANYYEQYASPKVNPYHEYQKSMSIKDLQPKEQRQIHRKINPTYLSYGSPSIGLAGKNIVGY